jgi:predicted transcriptional regulator
MTTLTITISDSVKERLDEKAAELGQSIDQIVENSIEAFLGRNQRIKDATDYVLKKNEELYRRLA